MFSKFVLIMLPISGALLFACNTTSHQIPNPTYTAFTQNNEYIIGSNDILKIQQLDANASAVNVAVSPDGFISLPLIGNIVAAGKTQPQLKDILTNKYREYYKRPDTTINVEEVRSLRVFVVGEVRTSGEFKYSSRTSVLGTLAKAAGVNEYSNGTIMLIRKKEAETIKYVFTLKELIEQESQHAPVYLERDDIIVVD